MPFQCIAWRIRQRSVIKISDLYGMFHVVKQIIKLIVIPIVKLKEISLVEINLMYSIIWWASIFIYDRFNGIHELCHGSIQEASW